jgi:hypothetical protein
MRPLRLDFPFSSISTQRSKPSMLLDGSSLDKVSGSEDPPVKGSKDDIKTHCTVRIAMTQLREFKHVWPRPYSKVDDTSTCSELCTKLSHPEKE